MVCDDVKRVIYFYLDGELAETKKLDLSKHFDECPGCGERVLIQRRLRDLFRLRLTRASAPDSLRTRISQAFHAQRP